MAASNQMFDGSVQAEWFQSCLVSPSVPSWCGVWLPPPLMDPSSFTTVSFGHSSWRMRPRLMTWWRTWRTRLLKRLTSSKTKVSKAAHANNTYDDKRRLDLCSHLVCDHLVHSKESHSKHHVWGEEELLSSSPEPLACLGLIFSSLICEVTLFKFALWRPETCCN